MITRSTLRHEKLSISRSSDEELQASKITLHGRRSLLLLSLACGVGVSNIYYSQPLLLEIARSLHVLPGKAGEIAVATQFGYATGIFLFAPLSDSIERRGLIARLFAGVSVAAFAIAISPTFYLLLCASVVLGLTAAVTQVTLPIAPELVSENDRGRAVGTVMTGLLVGILLARTFSGLIGQWLGWRSVFYIAAAVNLAFVPLLMRFLPRLPPARPVAYGNALRSLWTLLTGQPLLREAAVVGGLVMAAFCVFWTTLTFLLGSHYGMGPGVAGGFGVLGAIGALSAPYAGRMVDRHGTRAVIAWAVSAQVLAYMVFWLLGFHIVGLIIGVLIFDVGVQATQIANQSRIFGIDPHSRGRINTVYMMTYFAFGAAGSASGAFTWQHGGWYGVCGLGTGLLLLAGLRHVTSRSTSGKPV